MIHVVITVVDTPHVVAEHDGGVQAPPAVEVTSVGKPGTTPRNWPTRKVIGVSAAALVCSFLVGALLYWLLDPAAPVVESSLNVFALLFVLALVIERVLQPFSQWLGPDTAEAKQRVKQAKEAADRETAAVSALLRTDGRGTVDLSGTAKSVSDAQGHLDEGRDQTSVVAWAAASGLGVILSGTLGVGVLDVILASSAPAFLVDMAITGMVIGAGTKPLNDLWTRLQNK
jgi:high-affinity Fe2+/Pb2+ permease